jgi:TIR domain
MNAATDDVFLSYNSSDAPAVRQIQAYLKEAGLTTFLDRCALPAGQDWQPRIETALAGCRALVILVGPSGFGTWQGSVAKIMMGRSVTHSWFCFQA